MAQRIDNAPTDLSRKHPEIWLVYEKYGGGFIRPDRTNPMDWTRVTGGIDGFDNKATIRVALRDEDLRKAGEVGARHIGHLIGLKGILHPDLRVRIFQPGAQEEPPAAWLFEGYPMVSTASWTEDTQSVEVSCISAAHELLRNDRRAMIDGRRMFNNTGAAWKAKQYLQLTSNIRSSPVHFNAGGRPNREAVSEAYKEKKQKNARTYYLYTFTEDDAPGAKFWTYADALRYLVWWHIIVPGIDFSVTNFMADTNRFLGKDSKDGGNNQFDKLMLQRVEDERVDAMPVEHAIRQLVNRAGLHYSLSMKVDKDGGPEGGPIHYLRVFPVITLKDKMPRSFTMGWPERHVIPREAPFTDLSAHKDSFHAWVKANAVQQATITIDSHLINQPIFIAGIKFYEVTLLLVPGWLPFRNYEEEGYKNYPGLDDVPDVNVLDDVLKATLDGWNKKEFEKQVKVIKDYWDKGDPKKAKPSIDGDGKTIAPWQFDRRHSNFDALAEVGRKWIYPTDARYGSVNGDPPSTSDYWRTYADYIGDELLTYNATYKPEGGKRLVNRLMHQKLGGGIADAWEWIARRRPMGSPISRFPGGTKLPAWLEIKIEGDPLAPVDWHPLTGGAYLSSTKESAITVTMNNPMALSMVTGSFDPDENWFIWIARQKLYMRVTCLIPGDDRLYFLMTQKAPAVLRGRASIVDLGERFRWHDRGINFDPDDPQKITTNSVLAKRMPELDPDPEFESINEEAAFKRYAKALTTVLAMETVSGDPEIPWIAYDIGLKPLQLGDTFIGAPGVGLNKFFDPPELVNITYGNSPGAGYRTTMHLSDLRNDPTLLLETGD